jgi:serine phosphatase RsbU (regulator of sigma subunit)
MTSTHTEPVLPHRTPCPTNLSGVEGLDLHAQYHSARTGGDFFDALSVGSFVIFLLADIAGKKENTHGIAAEAQDAFRRRGREFFGAKDANVMDATAMLVQEINRTLIRAAHGVRFAPTFVGCYDLTLGVLAYVNAGGLTAVLRDSDGTRVLANVCMPMGLFTHLTYEPSMQAFEPGAKLLLVTKGVVDTKRGRTSFGVERVLRVLQAAKSESATEVCQDALKAAEEFKDVPWYKLHHLFAGQQEREDDLTALAVIRPAHSAVT